MRSPDNLLHKIAEGQWDDSVSWEFYLSNDIPDPQLCTAVYRLAIVSKNPERVALARNKRGWEMLGGHIEPGEDMEAALVGESLEEGGFYPSSYQSFGYRKIIAHSPVVNDHHGGHYPLVSYIPHFVATTDRDIVHPTGEEIHEAAVFEINSMPDIEELQRLIALAGLAAHTKLSD